MSSQKLNNLSPHILQNAQSVQTIQPTSEIQPTQAMKASVQKTILRQEAIPVVSALLSDQMQVVDMKTGKMTVKMVDKTKITIAAFDPASKSLRPVGITPKQNYSTVDHVLVNLYGHKGPDEPSDNNSGVMPT